MKLPFFIGIVFLLNVTNATSQSKGYISTDSIYLEGFIEDRGVFINNRRVSFSINKKKPFKVYRPNSIKEYGFEKGRIYVSKKIQEDQALKDFFLFRLVKGEAKLYALKIDNGYRFFGEDEQTMIELKRDSLRINLVHLLDNCKGFEQAIASVKYNKSSLKRAFELHNSCYTGHFPTSRKGFYLGVSFSKLSLVSQPSKQSLTSPTNPISIWSNPSPFFGAFINFPIGSKPMWYMNVQTYVQLSKYYQQKQESSHTLEFIARTTTLNIPILFTYQTTGLERRRFINLGPTFTYYLKKENEFRTDGKNTPPISEFNLYKITNLQISGTIGLGLEFYLKQKASTIVELRFNSGVGIGNNQGKGLADSENQRISELQLIAALYF